MARLRTAPNPNPTDSSIILPPPSTKAPRTTRSCSPRKTQKLYESPSKRELRYTSAQENDDSSFLIPKIPASKCDTPKKQRVLRPVASNSRLLRKVSNESLPSPEKERKERRERLEARDSGLGFRYSRGLARRGAGSKDFGREQSLIDLGDMVKPIVLEPKVLGPTVVEKKLVEPIVVEMERTALEDEVEERVEQSSIMCYDEEEDVQAQIRGEQEQMADEMDVEYEHAQEDQENDDVDEKVEEKVDEYQEEDDDEDEDEDDEPVVNVRYRRQLPTQSRHQAYRIDEDYETEEDEEEEDVVRFASQRQEAHVPELKPSEDMLPPLRSMRPPHRKGRSTISEWAQDVIDLTDSPEPPASVMLPPTRTGSFSTTRPTSSSSNDAAGILVYSPTPTKQRSPHKAPPLERRNTPPPPPDSPSKLVSPSKKKARIPEAPNLRPSLDAFWNPEVINTWNEIHSPTKPLLSPRKQKWLQDTGSSSDSDSSSISPRKSKKPQPKLQSPTKKPSSQDVSSNVKEARAQRKAFSDSKHALAESFLAKIDNTITSGRIASMSESTGGIKLIWSKTLKTTAGRANWRREQLRIRSGPLPADTKTEYRHHCSIELAEKVIDDEERLYNVLAHEYCHLTTFMISEVRNNPHGAEFKSWAAKVSRAFSEKGVEVTTKHSYQIAYKYVWECIACGYEFKRHSKSVDPARHSCGRCKGKLVQTKPTPRGAAKSGDGKPKEKSEYQLFVKANYADMKKKLEQEGKDTKLGNVMAAVAEAYRKQKDRKTEKGVVEVEELLEGLKIQDEDT